LIYAAAKPGHSRRIRQSVAHDQIRLAISRRFAKSPNVLRGVLSIAIHRQRPGKPALGGAMPARIQGCSLPA